MRLDIIVFVNSLEDFSNDLTIFTNKYDSYVSKNYSEDWSKDLSDLEFLNIVKNDSEFVELYQEGIKIDVPLLYLIITITLSFIILVASFLYNIIKKVFLTSSKRSYRFERTKTGKILVEQIAGMKKYIHDFSLLAEKHKEKRFTMKISFFLSFLYKLYI